MTDAELETLLEQLEEGLTVDVQTELDYVAREFARRVDASTELVAAVYSVSSIRALWQRRVPRIIASLRRIVRRSSTVVATEQGVRRLPESELTTALADYYEATEGLLNAVGDRLAARATQSLAEGVAAGETQAQLKRRLKALFSNEGAQLGPVRADRIAQTEATRAFNAGAQATAQAIEGPDRPLVKQWLTRHDERVRASHSDADGQIRLLGDPFDVGGSEMQYPGDPAAPADETINCRCILRTAAPATTEGTASMGQSGITASDAASDLASRMPPQLKAYWLTGPGAAKIRWGTPGSFDRCVRALGDDFPQDPQGLCANLYHEATGRWPGRQTNNGHTGAMVALIPSEADLDRLAAFANEPREELHATLLFLGEAEHYSEDAKTEALTAVQRAAQWLRPVRARIFGAALWNPQSDSPAWVWNVGDDLDAGETQRLRDVHQDVTFSLEDRHGEAPVMPEQHSPWMPHVTAAYGELDGLPDLADACGPVTFDRLRVAFAGEVWDIPLEGPPAITETVPLDNYAGPSISEDRDPDGLPAVATWSTPDNTALAFENRQTGDGRVFTPDAIYWDGNGPWPLMANENFDSHDDAGLAGAIHTVSRVLDRIPGAGVLYLTQDCGAEAAMLLAQGAPLGVSVDLDDVDVEMVDATGRPVDAEWPEHDEPYRARLLRASVLPLPDGGYAMRAVGEARATASGSSMVFEAPSMTFFVGPDGRVPAAAFELAEARSAAPGLAAAAGDPGTGGTVLDEKRSGDFLMRITRARLRGATLVTIPAFADARIVLDDPGLFASADVTAAMAVPGKSSSDYDRVLRHVRRSKAPVGPARVAQFLRIPIMAVQRLLARAASRGEVVRLTRGLYTDATSSARADHVMDDDRLSDTGVTAAGRSLTASASGAVDLPVAGRDHAWDGDAATNRVFEWADGDTDKIGQAYAYRDDSKPPAIKAAYKLGYADVIDGELTIVPRGVSAALAALNGARGGVDIPADEKGAVKDRLDAVRAHVDEETGEDSMNGMQASAWTALSTLPPMPAAWFAEPTAEELPPGGPGVNYAGGRIFGWVAQSNVPHAGYAKRVVINELGKIDTTEFLRQRFTLDDGSVIKAGAFTMNVGHHRDGAECETSACQFDDTRTVAGVVTVGMNERGMWFSGAAAPWLSEWDRTVFTACQPSYHLKRAASGQWKLSAVLSVPVPGHPSALLASAVTERSQLALTAAAAMVELDEALAAADASSADGTAEQQKQAADEIPAIGQSIDYDRLADSLVAAMGRAEARRAEEEAELRALLAMADTMDLDTTETEGA